MKTRRSARMKGENRRSLSENTRHSARVRWVEPAYLLYMGAQGVYARRVLVYFYRILHHYDDIRADSPEFP